MKIKPDSKWSTALSNALSVNKSVYRLMKAYSANFEKDIEFITKTTQNSCLNCEILRPVS